MERWTDSQRYHLIFQYGYRDFPWHADLFMHSGYRLCVEWFTCTFLMIKYTADTECIVQYLNNFVKLVILFQIKLFCISIIKTWEILKSSEPILGKKKRNLTNKQGH